MSWRRVLAYAAIYLLWGGTYLAVRTVVLVTPPFSAAALRFVLSGLILLAVSRSAGRDGRGPWPTWEEWKNSAKLGFVMFAINYACFFWAEQRLYSGIAAVVVATLPVWIFLMEWLVVRTARPSWGAIAGTVLGISGVVLLMRHNSTAVGSHGQTTLATCVLMTGTICWGAGSVWSRKLALPANQMMRSALQMGIGGLFLGVLAVFAGEGRWMVGAMMRWDKTIWLCFAYLIAASIVAFTAYVWLLHHEPAGRVATYAYVNPVVAMGLGVGLAHERIGVWQMGGAGLVLLGVFATLTAREGSARRSAVVETA